MSRRALLACPLFVLQCVLAFAAGAAPAADCPPLGRLPGYVGSDEIQRRSYDGAEFNVQTRDDDWQTVKAAGDPVVARMAASVGVAARRAAAAL